MTKTVHITEWFTDRVTRTKHELDYVKSQDHIREGLEALLEGAWGYLKVWTYEAPEEMSAYDLNDLVDVLERNDFYGAELVYRIELHAE